MIKKIKDNKTKNKKPLNKKSNIEKNLNKLAKQNLENRKNYNKTKYGTYKKYENSSRTYENNTSTNSKKKDDIFPQVVGVIILAGILAAIVLAISGEANEIFSKKYFFMVALTSVGLGIGVLLHNPEEEARKKRIEEHNKAAKERDKTKVKQDNESKSSKEGSSGTAFFIDDKGHLITNNHVVKGFEDKAKIYYDNEEINLKFIAADEQLDLALLKANVNNKDYISMSDKIVKKMQNIVAAGYPLGKHLSDDLKFTSGIVSSLKGPGNNSAIMQIDAALNPGNSGGPIVDKETGYLAGVAVAGLRKDVTEGINYGIKASRVKDFLVSNRIYLKANNNSSNNDVSDKLENSTVYISCG